MIPVFNGKKYIEKAIATPLQNLPKILILGKIAKKVDRGKSLKTINASRYY